MIKNSIKESKNMETKNHHQLLDSVINKLHLKSKSRSRIYSDVDKSSLDPSHDIFNRYTVKNALSKNTSLSISEKLNLFKTYEEAVKYDQQAVVEQQSKIRLNL